MAAPVPTLCRLLSVAAKYWKSLRLFAITTVLERKALGPDSESYGPNRVGRTESLQPAARPELKLIKEDLVPRAADKLCIHRSLVW